jgi:hypothetical protein
LGGWSRRIMNLKTDQTKLVKPCLINKRMGSIDKAVEYLPSMCNDLVSTLSTTYKKIKVKKKKKPNKQ